VASTPLVWPRGVEQYHGAAVAAGGDRLTHPRPQAAIAVQGFELLAIGGSPGQTAPGGADQQQGRGAAAFEEGMVATVVPIRTSSISPAGIGSAAASAAGRPTTDQIGEGAALGDPEPPAHPAQW
jgi:hypothetical protein